MRKRFKGLLTSILAFALLITNMAVFTVPALAEDEAVAYISYAAEDWGAQYWFDGNDYAPVVANNQTVTGYGQYTVSLDVSGVEAGMGAGIAFLDVEISNGETLYPNSFMTIDSLKINGEEADLGKTYTSSDDQIATRTNLYNEWVAEVTEGRTADGDITDLSAMPLDKTAFPEIKTIEVTFTLGDGVPFGGTEAASGVTPLPAEGTSAYIAIADNAWGVQYWFDGNDYAPVVANNATVTGYGQYTASLDFTGVEGGVLPDIVFMDVEVAGGELYFPNSYMQIDSVKINGEDVAVGNTYTSSDDGVATRTNLYNTWVATVEEGRTNGLDLTEVSATPIDGASFTNIETVEVTFTLIEGEPLEAAEEEVYVMPTEFNAFMMFSDVSGAWESYAAGTPGDTTVIGDGTYTVYLKASDVGATGQATEGQVFLVDIEGLGRAMVELGTLREADDESLTDTDVEVTVEVYVDGEKVTSKNNNIIVGDLEGNGRLRLELYNTWGTGTMDNPVVMPAFLNPADEIKVVFTLVGTGLNTGAVIEEPEAETPATTEPVVEETATEEEDEGLNVGILIAIIAGVAVAIGGGVFVMTQKKNKK